MKAKSAACVLSATALLAACVVAPVQMNEPFVEEDLKACYENGSGSIFGQAFLKTNGGDVKFAAGETVFLFPITKYTTELIPHVVKNEGISNGDERIRGYIKETKADGTGNFEFGGLSDCRFLVLTIITWEYETTGSAISPVSGKEYTRQGTATSGGWVGEVVKVEGNMTTKVIADKLFGRAP